MFFLRDRANALPRGGGMADRRRCGLGVASERLERVAFASCVGSVGVGLAGDFPGRFHGLALGLVLGLRGA